MKNQTDPAQITREEAIALLRKPPQGFTYTEWSEVRFYALKHGKFNLNGYDYKIID